MKPDELFYLNFAKECVRHLNSPENMFTEFSIDHWNKGILVNVRHYGHNHCVVIPFTDIEKFGNYAVYQYLSAIWRKAENLQKVAVYCDSDVIVTEAAFNSLTAKFSNPFPKIERVIFNNPATIILWDDNTKTIVKAENETFDPEKGLAMAITKKALGNEGNYYNELKKYLGDDYETKF